MSSHTILADRHTIQEMQAYYQDYLISPVPYSQFRAKKPGVVITAYQSGKVLFQGSDIENEVAIWSSMSKEKSQVFLPPESEASTISTKCLIGSDEVGNGSYFGALTVCAVYLDPEHFSLVQQLGVKDSKLLSDSQIKHLAPKIKASIPYHLTTCPPAKYNQVNQKQNANAIKAILHNFTLNQLWQKLNSNQQKACEGILIDQFTPEKRYWEYVSDQPKNCPGPYYFHQKAENIHLAVACASIIARAAFLESLVSLGQPYGIKLLSGAGTAVDQQGRDLVQAHGPQVLNQVAKYHFANTKKILNHNKK
ncbi:ribonuclease HIII [Vaginisenegalia massiliensis]|uniref:ribonuclease HIII n=1 Tax=Vaginisenegalia massiliensis TaxID=2058294 RepID=UPI000F5454D8|nr:ribonuclease HIII [Vaginisenegalia massiliensis]